MSNWLSITKYSVKHGISPSTIRRRIKAKKIKFKTERGKYFIFDDSVKTLSKVDELQEDTGFSPNYSNMDELISFAEKSISTVSKLNKNILEEKDRIITMQEKTILQLREQVNELKMLIDILEKTRS